MTNKTDDLGIADTSLLTDSDWAEINKLKRAYDEGGSKALSKALEELKKIQCASSESWRPFIPKRCGKQQKMSSQN
jgi:hypothetical protein